MTWIRLRPRVLLYSYAVLGVFVVLASALTVAYSHPATTLTAGAVSWYLGLSTIVLVVLALTLLLRRTTHQRLTPRLHLIAAFLVWVTILVGSTLTSNLATLYLLLLLEAGALFLLLTLVAHRIRAAFAPQSPGRWLLGATLLMSLGVIILTPTELNYQLSLDAGTAVFTVGIAHAVIIGAGFALLLIGLLYIPLGRPRLVASTTYSVGPLVFSEPETPSDSNLIQLTEDLVARQRRHLLKRGMWLHYRNYVRSGTGIISTLPRSLEEQLTTLMEYAAHRNQARAISLCLYNDPRHRYLHWVLEYVVNTHAAKDFTEYADHLTHLGGALTVERDERTTRLVVTFPLQW